jgi:hypothetical protein
MAQMLNYINDVRHNWRSGEVENRLISFSSSHVW